MKNTNEKVCDNCQNFYPHFNISKQMIFKVHCGHCKLRVKNVNPTKSACKNFLPLTEEVREEKKINLINKNLEEIEKKLEYFYFKR